ncbi:N-6 DNA methylase [Patescibacteria group bacterium]|nr:N-6 DNA methylase [Patescibacteria group bacterium]
MKNYHIKDLATNKIVDGRKPEEAVRQKYEKELFEDYGYLYEQIDIEVPVQRGEKNSLKNKNERADIVIYESTDNNKRNQSSDIIGIVEIKRPTRKEGIKQLSSYMSATSAIWGVWTNGEEIEYLYREPVSGKIKGEFIFQIPKNGETFADIGRISKKNLQPSKNLKVIFHRLLKTLYANTNISRKEKLGAEMIRLIFCKIVDEKYDQEALPKFRVGFEEKPKDVAKRIKDLFEEVKNEFYNDDVFEKSEQITLDPKSIAHVVGQLEKYSLMKTQKDVVGDAFEVFAESKLVGEKGEFFTPREIVKIAVKITDPQPGETIVDPACGSGGFLIYSLEHVWEIMDKQTKYRGMDEAQKLQEKRNMAEKCFFGIDKENDLVKIAKAYMAIIGDGKCGIVSDNTLHLPEDYNKHAQELFVEDEENNILKQFDLVLTNPPFGSKIKVVKEDSKHFDLGHAWKKDKNSNGFIKTNKARPTEPQVLFVERCLQMLKIGGRLALVLPETYFHAPKVRYVLDYLVKQNNVKAVVDLPHDTFRPYCNAKTLLIVIEKGMPQQEKITMAVCEGMGHDHNGQPLYRFDEEKNKFTDEVWNDSEQIISELSTPSETKNKYVFTVDVKDIKGNIYVPRYYWKKRLADVEKEAKEQGFNLVSIRQLIKEGIIATFPGHGSPQAHFKGRGDIPYVRVADIVNWAIYKNPTAHIPEFEYKRVKGNGFDLQEKDVLFVRRGSYRIGSVAIISDMDTHVLLTKEIQTFRIINGNNKYGIDAFYLLYLFSHALTQKQLYNKILIDTTLPNIGDRWKELQLPVSNDVKQIESIKARLKTAFEQKWKGQGQIESLARQYGHLTT